MPFRVIMSDPSSHVKIGIVALGVILALYAVITDEARETIFGVVLLTIAASVNMFFSGIIDIFGDAPHVNTSLVVTILIGYLLGVYFGVYK
jgi:hypothetical protein